MHIMRESWLTEAIAKLRPRLEAIGLKLPKKLKVSCGFPGNGSRKKRVGEAWPSDGKDFAHIFISPLIVEEATPVGVLAILLHEVLHVCLPKDIGHKSPFGKHAKTLGLEGKPASTTANTELCDFFKTVVKEIGPYPHRSLSLGGKDAKKQGTRMLKVTCPECGFTVRTTKKWIDALVEDHKANCWLCGHEMVFEGNEDETNESD